MKPGEPEARGMLREAGNMAWTSRPETGGPESRERERERGREERESLKANSPLSEELDAGLDSTIQRIKI